MVAVATATATATVASASVISNVLAPVVSLIMVPIDLNNSTSFDNNYNHNHRNNRNHRNHSPSGYMPLTTPLTMPMAMIAATNNAHNSSSSSSSSRGRRYDPLIHTAIADAAAEWTVTTVVEVEGFIV